MTQDLYTENPATRGLDVPGTNNTVEFDPYGFAYDVDDDSAERLKDEYESIKNASDAPEDAVKARERGEAEAEDEPAESGADETVERSVEETAGATDDVSADVREADPDDAPFDPGEYTVEQIRAQFDALEDIDPADLDAIAASEAEGKGRSGVFDAVDAARRSAGTRSPSSDGTRREGIESTNDAELQERDS